jgi:hypothetical protein
VKLKGARRKSTARFDLLIHSFTPRYSKFSTGFEVMIDEDGNPMFAFQDLDYIPFGFSSHLAPYIETGPGTMRAAATLMRLGLVGATEPGLEKPKTTVVCDLGCGDGEFRTINPTVNSALVWFRLSSLQD